MSNEVALLEINKQIAEVQATRKFAESLMQTKHYQTLGVDGVCAITAKARSLGMDIMYALNGGLYFLQGKVGMPAEAMAAMIRERGHSIQKDPKSTDDICILHGRRADNGDLWTSTFSVEHARKAGLLKNSYEKYQGAMLYNRAMSFLARQLFPDIIKGAGYTPDEIREIVRSDERPTKQIEEKPENLPLAEVEEKPEIVKISKEQAKEIKKVLSECSDEYQEQNKKTMLSMEPSVKFINDVPLSCYDSLMKAALKNRMEYQASLAKEDAESMESVQ